MAGVSEQRMSDDRVKAATGRIRAVWYALLDADGVPDRDHPAIATKTIKGTRAEVLEPVLAALVDQLGEPASLRPDSRYATALGWKALR